VVDDQAALTGGWWSDGGTGRRGGPVRQCRQPRLPESWSPMGSIVFLPLLLSTSGRNVHGSPGQTDKIPQGGKCNILDGNWPACRSLQRPRLLSHSLAPQKKKDVSLAAEGRVQEPDVGQKGAKKRAIYWHTKSEPPTTGYPSRDHGRDWASTNGLFPCPISHRFVYTKC